LETPINPSTPTKETTCKSERPLSGLETLESLGIVLHTGIDLAKVNDRLAVWRHNPFLLVEEVFYLAKVNDRLAVWRPNFDWCCKYEPSFLQK